MTNESHCTMTRAVCIALRAPSRGWPVPVISIARTWSSVSPCSSGVHGSEKRCHAQPWRSSTAARVYGSRPSMLTSTSAMPREDRRGGDQTVDRERPAVGVDLWNSEMGEHEDVFCGCDGVQHRVRRELDAANAARRVHRRPAWVCGAMRRLLAWVLDGDVRISVCEAMIISPPCWAIERIGRTPGRQVRNAF